MRNIAGSPVEGDNFFGRTADIARIKEALIDHDVLLLGPRRIGKTSVARAVMANVRQEKWRAIECNAASASDERGFLEKLEDSLRKELGSTASDLWKSMTGSFDSIKARIKTLKVSVPGGGSLGMELGEGAAEDWTRVATDVLTLIARLKEPWLIYVDELPIFLFNIIDNDKATGVQRVRRFLDWFRNDVRDLSGAGKVKWLISGSVGLDTLVQQHRMADVINSFQHATLPPFSKAEAVAMLRALADLYRLDLDDADAAKLLTGLQWRQPYYIQRAFRSLRELRAGRPDAPLPDLIEEAVEEMTRPGADNDFHHWESRLEKQLPPDQARHARALLAQAASTREGARSEALLASLQQRIPNAEEEEEDARKLFIYLRDILARDAYWEFVEVDGVRRCRFLLEPLRRWWHRRNTV